MIEFLAGTRDGHVLSRSLVWLMWLIPIVIAGWLTFVYRRADIAVLLVISVAALIAVTIYLVSGAGGYDIITPDQRLGNSNGVYTWIRTDGSTQFLSFYYYVLLAVALIYLTAFSLSDRVYWILVGVTLFAYVIAALLVPQIVKNCLGSLGSLSTLVMLALGIFTVLLVPG